MPAHRSNPTSGLVKHPATRRQIKIIPRKDDTRVVPAIIGVITQPDVLYRLHPLEKTLSLLTVIGRFCQQL
jgi:hypothetical protein